MVRPWIWAWFIFSTAFANEGVSLVEILTTPQVKEAILDSGYTEKDLKKAYRAVLAKNSGGPVMNHEQLLKSMEKWLKQPYYTKKKIMVGKMKGTPLVKVIHNFPKTTDTVMGIFMDYKFWKGIIMTMADKAKAKEYSLVCLAIIIVMYIFSFLWTKDPEFGFFKKLFRKLIVLVLTLGVQMGAFYHYFPLSFSRVQYYINLAF